MVIMPDGTRPPTRLPLLNRIWRAFVDQPALVFSLVSLFVAIASFVLTWIIQSRDAYYKELPSSRRSS